METSSRKYEEEVAGLAGQEVVRMHFGGCTDLGREISCRGQKRAALATTTDSTIPCPPKKQTSTSSYSFHSHVGSSASVSIPKIICH